MGVESRRVSALIVGGIERRLIHFEPDEIIVVIADLLPERES